jgi:hypothetical protein
MLFRVSHGDGRHMSTARKYEGDYNIHENALAPRMYRLYMDRLLHILRMRYAFGNESKRAAEQQKIDKNRVSVWCTYVDAEFREKSLEVLAQL